MAASSSSASRQWNYDVFPSFSGEDVRRTFLSHLLKEFQAKGIRTFEDSAIKRSNSIAPELVRAIRESRIAIVILSKNYASSSWCLNELLEIMECKVTRGQMVMTIFHDVDPSDVRKQTRDFGRIFEETCLRKTEDLKQRWKQALTDVADILGEHSKNWDSEAAMISKVATDVCNELNFTASKDFDNLVGIEAHISRMNSLLCLESEETRMIGIWGPAGIGKTTIARALYNRISRDFQHSVFMENVKGSYMRNNSDSYASKLQLQEQFLSEILDHKDMRISHLRAAEERLKSQRVLIVLDDVDKLEQLNALANRPTRFGNGSRIIVTTEDKHLLHAHKIKHIYEVDFPSADEALQIFSESAFTKIAPPEGYVGLAVEVAKLTSHLPLGLSVLGSALRGKSVREWIHELPRLKTSLNGDIEQVLRVGYDSLHDKDKAIFLHIACLFEGETIDSVMQFFANGGLEFECGLNVLVKRALTNILSDQCITMHHLLRQMGREIVRRQNIYEPGKRQFLIDAQEIYDVLADHTGTGTVLGILSNVSQIGELVLSERAFSGMHNLQFLRFHRDYIHKARLHLPQGLDCLPLPRKLKLLHWDYCPMKRMPPGYNTEFLVEIIMRESKLEKLWDGIQPLGNLKKLDLTHSVNLKELPDLSLATSLENLWLYLCISLIKLPSSIRVLQKLIFLCVCECNYLEPLPAGITLQSLCFLNICGCSLWEVLPNLSRNIMFLDMSRTPGIEVPPSFQHWSYLVALEMSGCVQVTEFPYVPSSMKRLNLERTGIKEVPPWIDDLFQLERLSMTDCKELRDISPNICKLEHLAELKFEGCCNVLKFPVGIFQSFCLQHELILGLDNINEKSLPTYIPAKTHTFRLNLSMQGIDFQHLPDSIIRLSQLCCLHLRNSRKLVSLPDLPDTLSELVADDCVSLEKISDSSPSSHNPKLILSFINCSKLDVEARKLLVEKWACGYAILPGDQVPEYFTHQARGNSLIVSVDRMHLSGSSRFKACIVLEPNDDDEFFIYVNIWCYLTGKHSSSVYKWPDIYVLRTLLVNHLFIVNSFFTLEEDNIPEGMMFFSFKSSSCKILSCGVQFLEPCPCPYSSEVHPKLSVHAFRDDGSDSDMDYGTEESEEEDGETTRSKKRERSSDEEEAERLNKNMRSH